MNTFIKLDLFHAVQCITCAMSKRHALYYPCFNDLQILFRSPGDIGKTRTMDTPYITAMLTNLNTFLIKQACVEHNGRRILTNKVMKQINAPQTHIEQGCLSQIKPGGESSQNEALHRYIYPHFNHTWRMGLPLAYMLYSLSFSIDITAKGTSYSHFG